MRLPSSALRAAAQALSMMAMVFGLMAWSSASAQTVRLQTNRGDIDIELHPDKSPTTVTNFMAYVKSGHFQDLIFHRVIDGFMIQTGGYTATLKEKPTRKPIPLESDNGLRNVRGAVAMARTSDPNSATAQFFINVADNPFLDKPTSRDGNGYAVFGTVVAGMDVVDLIKAAPTAAKGMHQNLPLDPIVIRKAVVVTP